MKQKGIISIIIVLTLLVAGILGTVVFYSQTKNSPPEAATSITITPPKPSSVMPRKQVIINQIIPANGKVNAEVVITGSGFTATGNSIKLTSQNSLSGYVNNLSSTDNTTLVFTIPDGLNLCSPESLKNKRQCPGAYPRTQPGTYAVSVINDNGESDTIFFEIL